MAKSSSGTSSHPSSLGLPAHHSRGDERPDTISQTSMEVLADDDSPSDIVTSEAFDISSDLCREAQKQQSSSSAQRLEPTVSKRFLARPSSAGYGADNQFTASFTKPLQNAVLGRTSKITQPRFVSERNLPAAEVKSSFNSRKGPSNDSNSSSVVTQYQDDLNQILVLPLDHGSGVAIHDHHTGDKNHTNRCSTEQRGPQKTDRHQPECVDTHHSGDSNRNDTAVENQTLHRVQKLQDGGEEPAAIEVQQVAENEDAADRDDGVSYPLNNDNDGSNLAGTSSPISLSPQEIPSFRVTQSSNTVLFPVRDQHRVQKPQIAVRPPASKPPYQQRLIQSASSTQSRPSEEDLLYLLMHSTRQTRQAADRVLKEKAGLEQKNAILCKGNADLRTELGSALAEREKLTGDVKTTQNELEDFRTRYKKIKAWALEMNAEHATLRQSGSELKTALKDLQKQHDDMWRPLQAHTEASSEALNALCNVKRDLKSTKQALDTLKVSLSTTEKCLAEKRAELRTLKVVEQQHKAFIEDFSKMHTQFHKNSILKQTELTGVLHKLTRKVTSESSNASNVTTLNECLRLVKEMSQYEPGSSIQLTNLRSGVDQLEQQLHSVQEIMTHGFEEIGNLNQSPLFKNMRDVKERLESLEPDVAKSRELREMCAKFEHQVKGLEELHELSKRAQDSAKVRDTEIFVGVKRLLEEAIPKKEDVETLLTKLTQDACTKLDGLVQQRDLAVTEVGKLQTKAEFYETRIEALEHKLEDVQHRRTSEKGELHAKYEQDIQNLRDENRKKQDQINIEMLKEIEDRDQKIVTSKQTLTMEQGRLIDLRGEVARMKSTNKDLEHQLQRTKASLSLETANRAVDKQRMDELTTKHKAMEATANTVSALEDDIRQKSTIIENLKADVKVLQNLEQRSQNAEADATAKQKTIVELRCGLDEAEAAVAVVEKLRKQLEESRRHLDATKNKLASSEKRADCVDKLEREARERQSEFIKIQSLLEDSQHKCKTIPALESDNHKLHRQLKDLEQELRTQLLSTKRASDLECELRRRDETVETQKQKLDDFEQVQKDFQQLQEQIQQQDTTIVFQTGEIARLKTQKIQTIEAEQQNSNDDLGGLFTQNTELSIDTHVWQDPQTTQTCASASKTNTDPVIASDHGVDPRVIMKATQPRNLLSTQLSGAKSTAQAVIVPDSQPGSGSGIDSSSQNDSQMLGINQRTSSPLSDIDEGFLDHNPYDSNNDKAKRHLNGGENDNCDSSGLSNETTITSPRPRAKLMATDKDRRRPASSSSSHEEMLLQGSETGRQSTPHAQTAQQGPRERNRPNSAVKRRVDHANVPESSNAQGGKRLKRANDRLRNLLASNQASSATRPDDLPTRNRSGGGSTGGGSASSKTSRRTRTGRRSTRQDRYSAQFNSSGL